MARGKHGTLSANRREQGSFASEIESYRSAVSKKQARISELEAEIAKAKETHSNTVRMLTARLNAAVSTELEAARGTISELQDQLGRMRAQSERIVKQNQTAFIRMGEHARTEHNLKGLAVSEWVGEMLGEPMMIADPLTAKVGNVQAIKAIQRRQGLR